MEGRKDRKEGGRKEGRKERRKKRRKEGKGEKEKKEVDIYGIFIANILICKDHFLKK